MTAGSGRGGFGHETAGNESKSMETRTETIDSPSGPMGVHVVRPDGDGPFPVVVFFHHGPGLEDGSKQTMARIADWGYYVVSHDRYHRADCDSVWGSVESIERHSAEYRRGWR